MPSYDCGDEFCDECLRAFGPNEKRAKAIAAFRRRQAFFASQETSSPALPADDRRAA